MNTSSMDERVPIDTYVDQTLSLPGGGPVPRELSHVFGFVHGHVSYTWERLHRHQALLLEALDDRGIDAFAAYAIGAGRSFVEPVVCTRGTDARWGLETAWELRHPFMLQRNEIGMQLIDVALGVAVADIPYRDPDDAGDFVLPNAEPAEVYTLWGGAFAVTSLPIPTRYTVLRGISEGRRQGEKLVESSTICYGRSHDDDIRLPDPGHCDFRRRC